MSEYPVYHPIQTAETREHDMGSCVLCDGSGFVVVPHLQAIACNCWMPMHAGGMKPHYGYCQAVFCSCRLGVWKADRWTYKDRPMTLERYQEKNPYWRQQWEERHQEIMNRPVFIQLRLLGSS